MGKYSYKNNRNSISAVLVEVRLAMTGQISVFVDGSSLELTANNAITGRICFRVDDKYFPEREWNDFVTILLLWWLEAIGPLISGTSRFADFPFMDGPFLAKARLCDGRNLQMSFIDRRKGDKVIFTAIVSIDLLESSIIEEASKVLNICDAHNWKLNEIIQLRERMKFQTKK